MTYEVRDEFVSRIITVKKDDKARFGRMNSAQMICHCADQFRMMFGEIEGLYRQNVDVVKFREMSKKKQTVPTPDGLDQFAGMGTAPSKLGNDKKILVDYLDRFIECEEDYNFSFHPFFGDLDKSHWEKLVIYHLNHHLDQFGR